MHVQISMFDLLEESWIEENLHCGSGFQGGKERIHRAALTLPDKEFAGFLKKEYGIGGRSIKEGFMDYNNKGIILRKYKSDYQEKYTWQQIAKLIKRMVSLNRY